jgi:hypothetical protein
MMTFSRLIQTFCLVTFLVLQTEADVYMHNPRGSNDRNCERTVNRKNGNRLFDSQNNNNGGYACPRGVGNEDFQPENGQAKFTGIDVQTGFTTEFTQNKRIYYYSGSILPIEWTNQHGCGVNSKATCEIVIQYACEDTLDPKVDDFWPWTKEKGGPGSTYRGKQHFRGEGGAHVAAPRDGVPRDSTDSATDTIPDNEASAIPNTRETRRFGMQESYDSYQNCQHTERNKGLYTADQRVRRRDRRGTRQNPNGNRRGLECPEERDYYPWWAPSPWIDIAVLTDAAKKDVCYPDTPAADCSKRCNYYHQNTMNTNKKGYCDVFRGNTTKSAQDINKKYNDNDWKARQWPNNKEACEKKGWPYEWYEVSHSDNLAFNNKLNFVCAHTQFARANQLGNARGDGIVSQNEEAFANGDKPPAGKSHITDNLNANRFLWTVPEIPTPKAADPSKYMSSMNVAYQSCVLRIRYNISTADYQAWPLDSVDNPATTHPLIDSRNNSRFEGDPRTPLMQDPYIYIGPGDNDNTGSQFVSLAINTNQYGRTFQDRSYVFTIKPLPTANSPASNMKDEPEIDYVSMKANLDAGGKIFNVNVRGKRGNIVQTFPSVEYDFVPNALALSNKDMVHFQWTGSDYNPRRGCNNGEGGPPDANTFFTDANAKLNPRADRSNLLFMDNMASNTPRDYTGYEETATMTYAQKTSTSKATILSHLPCYDPVTDTVEQGTKCYEQTKRLAYLNQQVDTGSLVLRAGKKCLTQKEIDDISAVNRDVAEHHPLNCAKINAKPFPYYDGGIMLMKKNGFFPYYSSRNNNFSNREQIGIICVGPTCTLTDNQVLQDQNPNVSPYRSRQTPSLCTDTANGQNGANANGAVSCVGG